MSPVSSPEVAGVAAAGTVRDAVAAATDRAMADVRAWQRTVEARIERVEGTMGELIAHARAAAAAACAQPAPAPVAAAPTPFVPQQALVAQQSPAAAPIAPTPPAEPAAQAAPAAVAPVEHAAQRPRYHSIAPGPDYPVIASVAPAQTSPWADVAAGGGFDPNDPDMMAVSGAARKRRLAFVVIFILVVGIGGLIAMMIASQAAHGL
jgi:hypothetical protein